MPRQHDYEPQPEAPDLGSTVQLEISGSLVAPPGADGLDSGYVAADRPYLLDERRITAALDRFIMRVAEREGSDLGQAAKHARAVFAALGEVIPNQELRDITDQLPAEYDALLLGQQATTGDLWCDTDARLNADDRDVPKRCAVNHFTSAGSGSSRTLR